MEENPIEPITTNPTGGTELRVNFKIRKKVLWWLILPLLIIGLLVIGLVRQGIVSDWSARWNNASANFAVVDSQKLPVENAQVIVGESSSVSNGQGFVSLTNLSAGPGTISIKKTGYLPQTFSITLKRGANDLGLISLILAPAKRVNVTLKVINYISEDAIGDTVTRLGDLIPIYSSGSYSFADTPIGSYKLSITKGGFNSSLTDVTISEKTVELEPVKLVPTGLIVFESNRNAGLRGLFSANYDGSGRKNLLARVGDLEDYSPILSPSGQKVLFHSTRDNVKDGDGGYKEYLYVIDLNGQNIAKIADSSQVNNPVWSADSRLIGFTNFDAVAGQSRLWLYNISNKTSVKLSDYEASGYFSLATDSKTVTFTGRLNSDTTNKQSIFLASSDGTGIVEIDKLESPNDNYSQMEFTATGKVRYSYRNSVTQKVRSFEYDPNTSGKTEVSLPATDRAGALLAPNKKLRAYISNRDGKSNVYISDPDGKNEKKLTELNYAIADLLWSSDSSFLFFNNKSSDESARYLVSVNGTAKAKKITDINLTGYSYSQ